MKQALTNFLNRQGAQAAKKNCFSKKTKNLAFLAPWRLISYYL
jgi:hypothetical protein